MGRVINPETAGKQRNQMVRAVVLALRELVQQSQPDAITCDLAAFIAITLIAIGETIDASVSPWEKRGYWVKADRFRLAWDWSGRLGERMRQAVLAEDWLLVAQIGAQVAEKLNDVKVPQRHRLGTPWVGAYSQLRMGDLS